MMSPLLHSKYWVTTEWVPLQGFHNGGAVPLSLSLSRSISSLNPHSLFQSSPVSSLTPQSHKSTLFPKYFIFLAIFSFCWRWFSLLIPPPPRDFDAKFDFYWQVYAYSPNGEMGSRQKPLGVSYKRIRTLPFQLESPTIRSLSLTTMTVLLITFARFISFGYLCNFLLMFSSSLLICFILFVLFEMV